MAKFLARSLQKRLITASATISTPQTSQPPSSMCALVSAMSITERDQASNKRAEKSASALNLFRDYGFEDSKIQKLMEFSNGQLKGWSERSLKPKLDYLMENGFTGELLHNLIVSCPYILIRSLDACIKPKFQLLRQYLDSDEKVVTAINRYKWILTTDSNICLIPNIEFLINEGVPVNRVSHLLLTHPRALMFSRDRMASASKTVRESGVAMDDPMFIRCLNMVCGLSESNLKKKLEVFKSFGWSDEQAFSILKKCPTCLGYSEEKLRSKMEFYLNTIELELETIIRHPYLLTRSVGVIHARYEVLKILKSKKLIKSWVKITSVTTFSEDDFLEKYVIKHEESVPGLLTMYNDIANKRRDKKRENAEP